MIELLFTSWPTAISLWCVLQLLDIWTTQIALARGASELNPIIDFGMRHLERYGWIGFKLMVASISAGMLFHLDSIWMLWALNLAFVGVVGSNFWQLKKQKKTASNNDISERNGTG
ncbi:hypothetical protein J7426_12465 [Tropicibacter sp. R16_0]|uniref:DUF5658 family protein n=1 Tax=Tropicibacter sp. R16_0 TaxID=2821102 RepID=UPI001ADAA632|nr:DUF5658 family protein [Tropicibacter sp. R16_0]MBO9451078.1 hypothetical protein [Tropicibacter sp. R16_0]